MTEENVLVMKFLGLTSGKGVFVRDYPLQFLKRIFYGEPYKPNIPYKAWAEQVAISY
jgi:hypothetical protein